MNKSLQDQLLGAGLVDGKKAKQISKDSRKQKKQKGKSKEVELNEAQIAALQVQQDKLERDQALNLQRKLESDKKALAAQVAQMISHFKFARKGGELEYNFTDNNKVKKILVTQAVYDEIVRGRLCVVRSGEVYELIPKPVAEKILERDSESVVVNNESPKKLKQDQGVAAPQPGVQSDDDYYAQFAIPDDLNW
jgi:uncharacterized protein YaiL (DUF2058 family)